MVFLGEFSVTDRSKEGDLIINASAAKILDESKFQGSNYPGMAVSALVVDFPLAGSHHGNSLPVDDRVVL